MRDDVNDDSMLGTEILALRPEETFTDEVPGTDEPAGDRTDSAAAPRADAPRNGTRLVSAKKLAANRANAQKSTGPHTAEGKRISSQNSLKHGLTARLHNVITHGDAQEDPFEFIELHESLKEELKPGGLLEELEVETIAKCYWRKWRAARWEVGAIERRTVGLREKEERRRQERVESDLSMGRGVAWLLEQHAAGVQHIIDKMRALKADLTARIDPRENLSWLAQEYPVDFEPDDSQKVQDDSKKVQVDGTETFWWTEKYEQRLNEAIDRHVPRLSLLREKLVRLEETKLDARIRAAMLNPAEVRTIGRYGNDNDRELDRALKRLDLLQRRRRFGDSKLPQW